jgi:hypothetical protein
LVDLILLACDAEGDGLELEEEEGACDGQEADGSCVEYFANAVA